METETILILLFVVATTVAIAVQRLAIPYTVALVVTGLLLGMLNIFEAPHLTKALLFGVFLPGLLFEAAFHIEFKQFWRNRLIISSLALPGVVAAIVLTAVILTPVADALHFVQGFTWKHALVFGALIAATDPIAVVAIFKNLGVPKRLSVLLDGESLLNDGTAIVFFTLSLALVTGTAATAGGLAFDFIRIVGIGALIGTGVGLAVSQVIRQVDDPMIEITLTTIAAYGSFLAAEHFHYSGVIATVAAGMLCGNYGARVGMSPSTRIAVETFWKYIAFALNSIIFLLIGLEVHFQALLASWKAILVAYLVVTGGRALVIFGVSSLLGRTRERIPWAWSVILTWGGLRGGLPMVLVLSLPKDFPHRELLVSMTFGVVILSILVHGLTMSPLLRWLGIVRGHEELAAYELTRGGLQATHAALSEIDQMSHVHFTQPDVLSDLRREYEQKVERDSAALDELHIDNQQLHAEELQRTRRHLLLVEKNTVIDAFHRGLLSQAVQEQLLADIDIRLLRLETAKTDSSAEEEPSFGHTDEHAPVG
ncbi:MAG: Na+/H+ antiporter [Deltaproteobacteria bacterium HGW-Deltaproteobacteria-1]|jgi:CPA1 family monovalent cation:H+ antiporter|nr:MAG: Na+/H+ antiporter [Deltaproteobacteria bacterium HGW-Deltaproteobacteria-1]